ncbi:MAG: hypothetical protein LUF35_05060 [Lachnospiraceae bacterium]|nr:hypothetical protein [Lachnospiraceae bacterium]
MEQIYIKKTNIKKVRHLSQIEIPVSGEKMKHLILTGKNGSGKTSLLNAVSEAVESLTVKKDLSEAVDYIENGKVRIFLLYTRCFKKVNLL